MSPKTPQPEITNEMKAKLQLADDILKLYQHGSFGSVPKREIDLHVFHHLSNTEELKGKSIHDLADALHITDTKTTSLLRDSAARFGFGKDELKMALENLRKELFVDRTRRIEFEGDKVIFSIDDPVLKRELSYQVFKSGYSTDSSFNALIVKMRVDVFVRLFSGEETYDEGKLKGILAKALAEHINAKDFTIDPQEPWYKTFRRFVNDHRDDIGLVSSVLGCLG